ncbi:hypothetical protein BXY75_3005 [Ulvibacter antarcticus]|uniref:Uncharacterized protein n=1 Tax=Ulvibacter antarcticus TaxID=442714 RepID=A0A3L9YRN3_9FLAO|nr:hypothetical protein BXY75_3005 [Ulvibacter antarcticus]
MSVCVTQKPSPRSSPRGRGSLLDIQTYGLLPEGEEGRVYFLIFLAPSSTLIFKPSL